MKVAIIIVDVIVHATIPSTPSPSRISRCSTGSLVASSVRGQIAFRAPRRELASSAIAK
ncbi:MAG: hypothetical protein ACO2OR_06730 [Desulfurococcaceae archaeon]